MKAKIRKIVTFVEETHTEMGRPVNPVTRRAAAAVHRSSWTLDSQAQPGGHSLD